LDEGLRHALGETEAAGLHTKGQRLSVAELLVLSFKLRARRLDPQSPAWRVTRDAPRISYARASGPDTTLPPTR
jgi:hypothetical protein